MTKNPHRSAFLAVLAALSCACSTPERTDPKGPPPELTQCSEPRPQFCTREYKPVCAAVLTGIQCITTPCPSMEYRSFGNRCDACANPKTTGYVEGSCEENGLTQEPQRR